MFNNKTSHCRIDSPHKIPKIEDVIDVIVFASNKKAIN